jgi:hypothetical protein
MGKLDALIEADPTRNFEQMFLHDHIIIIFHMDTF